MRNKGGNMEWILVSKRNPFKNGEYLVAWKRFRRVELMTFTTQGGWNTHVMPDGEVDTRYVLSDDKILAWAPMPEYPSELDEDGDDEW